MEAKKPNTWFHISMSNLLNKNLEKKMCIYDNQCYYSFQYDKNMLCYNDEETRLYRMVVYSYPEQKIICYFPPKALDYNHFKHYYKNITTNMVVNEYINGDMINLSYDERCNKWRLTTQSKKTNIIEKFKENLNIDKNEYTPILDYLQKNYSYTFVLKNNYTKSDNIDKFYLISVYEINDNNVKYISNIEYEKWDFLRNIEGLIYFPKKYVIQCYEDMHFIDEETDGYMIIDTNTGCKTKILSAELSIRKTMSEINPYHAYEYLCIRRINKLYEYNKIYKNTKNIRYKIHNEYEKIVTILHQHYMGMYVFKNNIKIPEKYRKYIKEIHDKVYIPSLRKENKEKITRNKVKEYLNILNPCELLYLLYQ